MAPTTRQQQKRIDAKLGRTGSRPSEKDETIMAPMTLRNCKAKAPAEGSEDISVSKRPQHTCNGTCAPYQGQTGITTKMELQGHRESHINSIFREESEPISSSTSPQTPRCAFFSLPRELRDQIYKHFLFFGEKRAILLQNQTFITKCPLPHTNKQLRQEFLDAVLSHAPVIHTTVRNHNFAHIVTFLNRLSESQLRKFAAAQLPNSDPRARVRSRKAINTLTYSRTKTSTKPQLNRWLDRFDDPERRGKEVRFEYRIDRESYRNGGYKQRASDRVTAGPRSREEARKLMGVAHSMGNWW